jgi:hypothetical protein
VTYTKQPSVERKPLASLFAGRLHAWAGIWLFAGVVGPCAEHAPTPEPASEQKAASAGVAVPGSASAAATPAASAPGAAMAAPAAAGGLTPHAKQQTPTTRSYMLTHYADTVGMRRALVSGKLADFRVAAAAVAKDEWTPRLRGDYHPYLDAVRAAASTAQKAPSVVAGAAAIGKLGEACASCHLKFGGPGSPVAPEPMAEGVDPSMIAHAAATDRLWEGLVWPSDTSWSSGMDVLLDAPKLDSDVADVAQAAHHLRELARKGKSAEVDQRGQIFASVLTTCAGCHERLSVSVRPTPSP